jgi:hypothetical protein
MSQFSRYPPFWTAIVAIALAGCGSSSNGGLSTTQLASRANAACTTYLRAATAVPRPGDLATNPIAMAAFLDKVKPLVDAQDRAIYALNPSSSAKPLWARFVAGAKHLTALFEDADVKAHAKDRAALTDLAQFASYKQMTFDPIASKVGATACAK